MWAARVTPNLATELSKRILKSVVVLEEDLRADDLKKRPPRSVVDCLSVAVVLDLSAFCVNQSLPVLLLRQLFNVHLQHVEIHRHVFVLE